MAIPSWRHPTSPSERPFLRLVVDRLHGWVTPAPPPVVALPVSRLHASLYASRLARAAEVRQQALAAHHAVERMPHGRDRTRADLAARALWYRADAWFHRAGGDHDTAREMLRCELECRRWLRQSGGVF